MTTIEKLSALLALIGDGPAEQTATTNATKPADHPFWKIGQGYFIRTITYHLTGVLVAVTDTELVLRDAAWIADSGRFTQAMAGGEFSEVEPWPDGALVLVGRGSIVDACHRDQNPRVQK